MNSKTHIATIQIWNLKHLMPGNSKQERQNTDKYAFKNKYLQMLPQWWVHHRWQNKIGQEAEGEAGQDPREGRQARKGQREDPECH